MLSSDFENAVEQKRILFYIRGCHHFHLVYNLVKNNPDYHFYFVSNFVKREDYIKSPLYALKNSFYIDDFDNLFCKLPLFGLYLTTDAQMTAAHRFSLNLSRLFSNMSVKTVELEHGLFQLGVDYFDVPEGYRFYNDSLPTNVIADTFLSYVQEKKIKNSVAVGYPPYTNQEANYYKGCYTLILSNLHWETYSQVEKYNFYQTVINLVMDFPDHLFIWRRHPGEIVNSSCRKMLMDLLNVLYPKHSNLLWEGGLTEKIATEDLIAKCENVITTPSTTLLDCEICQKDTYVYACKTNACLIEKLKIKSVFGSLSELKNIFNNKALLKTGKLQLYKNEAFRSVIEKNYGLPSVDKSIYLEKIIQYK